MQAIRISAALAIAFGVAACQPDKLDAQGVNALLVEKTYQLTEDGNVYRLTHQANSVVFKRIAEGKDVPEFDGPERLRPNYIGVFAWRIDQDGVYCEIHGAEPDERTCSTIRQDGDDLILTDVKTGKERRYVLVDGVKEDRTFTALGGERLDLPNADGSALLEEEHEVRRFADTRFGAPVAQIVQDPRAPQRGYTACALVADYLEFDYAGETYNEDLALLVCPDREVAMQLEKKWHKRFGMDDRYLAVSPL